MRRGFGLQDALSRDDRCFHRDLVRCRDIFVSIEEGNVQKHRRNRIDGGSGCRRWGLPEGATPALGIGSYLDENSDTSSVPSRSDQGHRNKPSRFSREVEEKHHLCAWCSVQRHFGIMFQTVKMPTCQCVLRQSPAEIAVDVEEKLLAP